MYLEKTAIKTDTQLIIETAILRTAEGRAAEQEEAGPSRGLACETRKSHGQSRTANSRHLRPL